MSLQVWLPLISNTSNIGVSSISGELSHSSITYETGKIGNAIRISNYMTSTATYSGIANKINWSICVWLKLSTSDGTPSYQDFFTIGMNNNGATSGGFRFEHTNTAGNFQIVTTKLTTYGPNANGYYTFYSDSTNCKDKWAHVVVINDGVNYKTYINGVLKNTIAVSTFTATTSMLTGSLTLGMSGTYCWLNDLRIYDHALSLREIKELSKGLVCHYPLNQLTSINNTVRNATYGTYNNFTNVGATGSVAATGETYDGCAVYRLTFTPTADCLSHVQTTLHGHGIMGFRTTFLANTKYCFWILYKPISHPDTICGGTASNIGGFIEIPPAKWSDDWMIVGQYRNGSITSDKTDNIFVSFKTPSATAGTPITIEFCCPHLVVGTQDILPEYDYQGNNPTIEYDTSGYCNHGTRSGTITYNSDTPRYSVSTIFDGTSSGIEIQSSVFPVVLNGPFTVSMWVYDQETGGRSIFFGNYSLTGSFFNIEKEGNNRARFYWNANPDFHCANSPIASNAWTHLVMTRNGNTVKCYINGILTDTSTATLSGTVPSNATTFRLGRDGRSDATMFKGYMSDFRLYATALSDTDIKELYNAPINFNKHSIMIQGEFIEK